MIASLTSLKRYPSEICSKTPLGTHIFSVQIPSFFTTVKREKGEKQKNMMVYYRKYVTMFLWHRRNSFEIEKFKSFIIWGERTSPAAADYHINFVILHACSLFSNSRKKSRVWTFFFLGKDFLPFAISTINVYNKHVWHAYISLAKQAEYHHHIVDLQPNFLLLPAGKCFIRVLCLYCREPTFKKHPIEPKFFRF